MKVMFTVIVGLCIAAVVFALVVVRTATHDVTEWHVDPLTFVDPTTPNFYRVGPSERMSMRPQIESPVYVGSPQLLSEAFDTFVMGQPRVQRVSPSAEAAIAEAWVTYVQTTPQIGFPDYISARFIDNGDGTSRIVLISRSRFGHGDLGVNEARVKEWLPGLEAFIQEPGSSNYAPAESNEQSNAGALEDTEQTPQEETQTEETTADQ